MIMCIGTAPYTTVLHKFSDTRINAKNGSDFTRKWFLLNSFGETNRQTKQKQTKKQTETKQKKKTQKQNPKTNNKKQQQQQNRNKTKQKQKPKVHDALVCRLLK